MATVIVKDMSRLGRDYLKVTPKIQVKKYGQSNGRKDRRGNI